MSLATAWVINNTFFHNENSYFVYRFRSEQETKSDLMVSYLYCVAVGSVFLSQLMRIGPYWGPALLWWNRDQLRGVVKELSGGSE